MSFFKTFRLLHWSKPAEDRVVYQTIQRLQATRILEIGLQRGERSLRMIQWAGELSGSIESVDYIGVDPFEGRERIDGPGMSFRKAHHLYKATGAKIRLMPGDPASTVTRIANSVKGVELIIVATPRLRWLDPIWFYLPRMLDDRAEMLLGRRKERTVKSPYEFKTLSHAKIVQLAEKSTQQRRRAA